MLTKAGEKAKLFLEEAGFVDPRSGGRVDVVRSVYDKTGHREIDESVRQDYDSLEATAIAFVKYCAEYTTGKVKVENGTLVLIDKKLDVVHKWTVTERLSTTYQGSGAFGESFDITITETRRAGAEMLNRLPKLEVVE